MFRHLKKLSGKLNGKDNKTDNAGHNQNESSSSTCSRDSPSLGASAQATQAERGQAVQEQTDSLELETEESELYDLNREPHGLFILHPKPDEVDAGSDIDIE